LTAMKVSTSVLNLMRAIAFTAAFWMRCEGLIAEAGVQPGVAVVETSDDERLDQDLFCHHLQN